jgi:hypothetical protein
MSCPPFASCFAGVYTFQLMHVIWGAAGLEPGVTNISVTYIPSITAVSPANISAFGGTALNISGFGFAPMRPTAAATTVPSNSSSSSSVVDPGSLSTATLDHYAVGSAAASLPVAAPGVTGIPLIPWDFTTPAAAQYLAPRNPPTAADVAAAQLVVAATRVWVKGSAAVCMVKAATETWVVCTLQRSTAKLAASNVLQVGALQQLAC